MTYLRSIVRLSPIVPSYSCDIKDAWRFLGTECHSGGGWNWAAVCVRPPSWPLTNDATGLENWKRVHSLHCVVSNRFCFPLKFRLPIWLHYCTSPTASGTFHKYINENHDWPDATQCRCHGAQEGNLYNLIYSKQEINMNYRVTLVVAYLSWIDSAIPVLPNFHSAHADQG